jgi:hypothetical protein
MRATLSILVAAVIGLGIVSAAEPARGGNKHGRPPEQAKHGGGPPGHAKHGGLPPGLAKKFGPSVPERCYIAVDPRYDDRAWFLIDGRWVLRQGFASDLRVEVRQVIGLPALPSPPPVPLPKLQIGLHVVLFG